MILYGDFCYSHGNFSRLSNTNWPIGSLLTRNDYVIVLGDFGLIFHNIQSKDEKWWEKWLKDKPYTILFVDGNHDNHPRLSLLPKETMFGGTVGKVADNIYHLRRGEIYTIEDKTFLAFGGADSIDKIYRVEGVSWWRDEIPSYSDMERCLASLERHGNKVDYILAHTCPQSVVLSTGQKVILTNDDPTQRMLDHIVSICQFSRFYCGHWHWDLEYDKYHFLYHSIVAVQ